MAVKKGTRSSTADTHRKNPYRDFITERHPMKETIDCETAAPYIGCSAQNLRVQIKNHPETVQYPFALIGNTIYIPERPFFQWLRGKEEENNVRTESND